MTEIMAIRNMRLDFVDSLANDQLFSYLCMYIITYKKMKTTSVSDFRTNMKRYLDAVIFDSDCVVINRGNTGAVLISLEEYNSIKGTEAILASERMTSSIHTGLEDITRGEVEEIDIDAL